MTNRGIALGIAAISLLSLFSVIPVTEEVTATDEPYIPAYSILVASYEWHYDYNYASGWVKEFFTDGSSKLILNEDVNGPTDARRTANGNTLITVCHGADQRVVELEPDGNIAWEYTDGLYKPWHSERLSDGNTLIADHWNHRVIEVNADGETEWEITRESGMLIYPLDATRLVGGNTLIVDSYHNRVIEVDFKQEHRLEYTNKESLRCRKVLDGQYHDNLQLLRRGKGVQ